MSKNTLSFLIAIFFVIVTACAPQTEPPPLTDLPLETAPLTEAPPTEAPPPASINLAGPTLGSKMPWVDDSILVYIPGGSFIMGAEGSDNPRITANIADFWIYRTEVTNRMYAMCVAVGICTPPADPQAASALTDRSLRNKPVTGVTWEQANVYCTWVQGRLPTEAQWEKAARGEQGNSYPWGDGAPTCDLLNFNNCTGALSDVLQYPSGKSYYDVLDMSGNVFEWVLDWYDPGYYTNNMENPEGPTQGEQRSVRGSSFQSPVSETLPSRRFFLPPDESRLDLGFRCVVINPTPLAPYCQTNAHTTVPPAHEAAASADCNLSASLAGVGPGFATADLQGGTITSVSATSFDCSLASESRVYCAGGAGSTDEITICGTCETTDPDLPELDCPPGYEPSLEAPGECIYQANGDASGCPPGSYFDTSLNRCVGSESSRNDGLCDTGMYFDTAQNACVSNGEPSLGCLSGYEFDTVLGCCRAPATSLETPGLPSYPGCGLDEYFAPGAGCTSSSEGDSSKTTCTTIKLTISPEKLKDSGSEACIPSPSNCYCYTPCP
ncbi:MAG: hypothetical protein Fur0043_06250 [Anaerolineales bacterium]